MKFKIISAISIVLMIAVNIFFLVTSTGEDTTELFIELLMPLDGAFVAIFGSIVTFIKRRFGNKNKPNKSESSDNSDNWDFD